MFERDGLGVGASILGVIKKQNKTKTLRDLHGYPVVLLVELLKTEILCRPESRLFSKSINIFFYQLPRKRILSMNQIPVVNREYFGL